MNRSFTARFKDDPPRDIPTAGPATVGATEVPPLQQYREILFRNRKLQLQQTRENLQRLAHTYDRAAKTIIARINAVPEDVWLNFGDRRTEWIQAQLNMLREIDAEIERYKRDYADLLDTSMLSTAQQAADRHAEIVRMIGAPAEPGLAPTLTRAISAGGEAAASVVYGALARQSVEIVANRYYRDGLKLSERLYRLGQETQKAVEDTVTQGIASGMSARNLAIELQRVMAEDGVATPRYNAMRIARTEMSNAFREATIQTAVNPGTMQTKSYVSGVRWSLSASHPQADICDVWAAGSSRDLPSGVYDPSEVPADHPHGLCYTTPELLYFPGVGGPGKTPDPESVPDSQVRYYAQKLDDPVAKRELARRGLE